MAGNPGASSDPLLNFASSAEELGDAGLCTEEEEGPRNFFNAPTAHTFGGNGVEDVFSAYRNPAPRVLHNSAAQLETIAKELSAIPSTSSHSGAAGIIVLNGQDLNEDDVSVLAIVKTETDEPDPSGRTPQTQRASRSATVPVNSGETMQGKAVPGIAPSLADQAPQSVEDTPEILYSCRKCGKISKSLDEWRLHQVEHEALPPMIGKRKKAQPVRIRQPQYSCPDCSAAFTRASLLKNHQEKAHDFLDLTCPLCCYKFRKRNDFLEHLPNCGHAAEQNRAEPLIDDSDAPTCICGRVFKSVSSLATHRRYCETHRQKALEETRMNIAMGITDEGKFPIKGIYNPNRKPRPYTRRTMAGICKYCAKPYQRLWSLRNHEKKCRNRRGCKLRARGVAGQPVYFCSKPHCGRLFGDVSTLKLHKVLKHDNGPRRSRPVFHTEKGWHCIYCPERRFRNKALLRKHAHKKHSRTKILSCGLAKLKMLPDGTADSGPCKKQFADRLGLESHRARVHASSQKREECTIGDCTSMFRHKLSLTTHERTHHARLKIHKCLKCGAAFAVKYLLNVHVKEYGNTRSHTVTKKDKKVICLPCNKVFKSSRLLSMHNANCHNDKDCPFCGMSFRPRTLRAHISREHNGEPTFTCQFCGEKFPSDSRLRSHRRTAHGQRGFRRPKEKNQICIHCGAKFDSPYKLKRHHVGVHATKEEREALMEEARVGSDTSLNFLLNKCKQCDAEFGSHGALSYHVASVHRKGQNFGCNVCSKNFATKRDRARHMDTVHSDERPFLCNQCGQTFKSNDRLRAHERHIHDEEFRKKKMRTCVVCQMTLRDNSALRYHLREKHEINPDTMEMVAPRPGARKHRTPPVKAPVGAKKKDQIPLVLPGMPHMLHSVPPMTHHQPPQQQQQHQMLHQHQQQQQQHILQHQQQQQHHHHQQQQFQIPVSAHQMHSSMTTVPPPPSLAIGMEHYGLNPAAGIAVPSGWNFDFQQTGLIMQQQQQHHQQQQQQQQPQNHSDYRPL